MAIFTATQGSQSWTEEFTVETNKVNEFITEIEKQINDFLNESKYKDYEPARKQLTQLLEDIITGKLTEQAINEEYLGIWWPRLTTDNKYVGLEIYNDDDFAFDVQVPVDLIRHTKTLQTPEDSIQNPKDVYSKSIKEWTPDDEKH